MPSKKKAIVVTITERAHKPKKGKPAQPWTVRIQEPGNKPPVDIQERYTRPYSAKMGAVRKLKAKQDLVAPGYFVDGRPVVFVVQPKQKLSRYKGFYNDLRANFALPPSPYKRSGADDLTTPIDHGNPRPEDLHAHGL